MAVSQTESSRRPSIRGGLPVRAIVTVGRSRGIGGVKPPPPLLRERGRRAGAASPPASPNASAPVTLLSDRGPDSAGNLLDAAAAAILAGGASGPVEPPPARGATRVGGVTRPAGTPGVSAAAESRAASAVPTSSWMSNRSPNVPSTRVLNAFAPVATSTTRAVIRNRSPMRCNAPSTSQVTPRRRWTSSRRAGADHPLPFPFPPP